MIAIGNMSIGNRIRCIGLYCARHNWWSAYCDVRDYIDHLDSGDPYFGRYYVLLLRGDVKGNIVITIYDRVCSNFVSGLKLDHRVLQWLQLLQCGDTYYDVMCGRVTVVNQLVLMISNGVGILSCDRGVVEIIDNPKGGG